MTESVYDLHPVKFSGGYNEGRNRREQLTMVHRGTLDDEDSKLGVSGSLRLMPNEVTLNKWFLNSRCRKHRNGKFILDLRGTAMERTFHRRLNDSDLDSLFEFIIKKPDICGLHFAFNSLTSYGFGKLSEFLAKQTTIFFVNVMNNDITYLVKSKFAEIVCKWNVQCLNLRGNKIGQKGGKCLAYLLNKNSTIRHLAIGETDQTVNSAISIFDTLIQYGGNVTLTKLDLTRTLTKTNTSELCRHLACLLEVNQSLTELVLSKNNISDLDLEIFLEGLKYRNNLSRLNLSCNHISSLGLELIANILPKTNLKLLVLATNLIGDSGAMALGRIFWATKLTYLDISTNRIGDLGMIHLLWAICRPMDGLLIFGNKFTKHAAKVIHDQFSDLSLDPNTLDVQFWFDEKGEIRYTRRNISGYGNCYYYVPEWKEKSVIQHCCCPIRGGILSEMKS